jgi:uncharacterized protein
MMLHRSLMVQAHAVCRVSQRSVKSFSSEILKSIICSAHSSSTTSTPRNTGSPLASGLRYRYQTTAVGGISKGYDILGDDGENMKCYIKKYGNRHFQINNVYISSSVLLFPNSYLQWNNVKWPKDITVANLSLFAMLYPTLELLIIGCGGSILSDPSQVTEIRKYFAEQGIAIELLDSVKAASMFNVLNGEGRNIAAALLTLKPVLDENEIINGEIDSDDGDEGEDDEAAQTSSSQLI